MKVKFRIEYQTNWGQHIYVCGSAKELGNWDMSQALVLSLGLNNMWEGEVEISGNEIAYKYFIRDIENFYTAWEYGEQRVLNLQTQRFDSISMHDFWREYHDIDNTLYTAPFLKAFFHRDPKPYHPKFINQKRYVRFKLRAPRIGPDYVIGLLGNIPAFGNWEEDQVLVLNDQDFPVWKVDIAIPNKASEVEYKYVIYDPKNKKVIEWEVGENRKVQIPKGTVKHIDGISEHHFRYSNNWRGAGVAIPVFSLRTETSSGVGEFTDIKLLIDWANKIGMRLVQILPINDTTATHTWVDSYPYAAITVDALHPIFANLDKIGKLKNAKLQAKIDRKKTKLNKLPEVDYEAVMKLKWEFFRESYKENTQQLNSKEFRNFFDQNKNWLIPYAAFCFLRDKNKTVDFNQWGEHSTVDNKKLEKLTSAKSSHYHEIAIHYYIQFHLDQQLKEASEYARSKGVVLKGDIPIGIYRNSIDAWLYPESFNMDGQAGAPPDDFSFSGQNWGFPTYNWNEMGKDGFQWWKDRLINMSKYFDVFRIDHILGFFRIWEIPWDNIEGLMGRFNPALPVHENEFSHWGIHFDRNRLCEPYIRRHIVQDIFGNHENMVLDQYLDEYAPGCYALKDHLSTQRKVKEHFDSLNAQNPEHAGFNNWVRNCLYRLLGEVLFLEAPMSDNNAYNPRIAFHSTYSYKELDDMTKQKLDNLYDHYYYKRHNQFWRNGAMEKLPVLKEATEMLICGEDLGMVPECVPGVMKDLNILSLAIQRMPNDDREFWHPSDTPYLSVTSTSSHDTSTIREWWQEDPDATERFYHQILGEHGEVPYYCEPWVVEKILVQHLYSPSMWAIFPIQDLLAINSELRRNVPEEERINIPAISQHYWRYRLHIKLEDLIKSNDLNDDLSQFIDQSGRNSRF